MQSVPYTRVAVLRIYRILGSFFLDKLDNQLCRESPESHLLIDEEKKEEGRRKKKAIKLHNNVTLEP